MAKKVDIHALDRDELISLVQRLQLRLIARRVQLRKTDVSDQTKDQEMRRGLKANMATLPEDIQEWVLDELMPAIVDLPGHKHHLYVSELWAIGRSLAQDLHIDIGDDHYKLALMITGLLTHDPGDGDEEEEPNYPKVGDLIRT